MRVVDKLIEHPEFTDVVSLIRHVAFVAGAKFVRNALANAGHSSLVDAPSSGPVTSVDKALLAFASMDQASLLGLGDLDMQGVCDLCAFSGSDCTPEDMVGGVDDVGHGDEAVIGGDNTVMENVGGRASGRVGVDIELDTNGDENDAVVVTEPICVDKIVAENVGGVGDFVGGVGGKVSTENDGDGDGSGGGGMTEDV